jgi:hypothetical protein
MEKAKGGDHGGRKPKDPRSVRASNASGSKTLAQLGISETQSSRWQQLAENPKAVEKYLRNEQDISTLSGAYAAPQQKDESPAVRLGFRRFDAVPCLAC